MEDYIELVALVYERYLTSDTTEDFTGLLIEGRRLLDSGVAIAKQRDRDIDLTKITHLMLDEYQDFNHQFQSLTDAIRAHSPSAKVFAVGDDWQAINRFAGADLKYFHSFEQYFPNPSHRSLETNYRSTPTVVELGNAVMQGRGTPGKAHRSTRSSAYWLDVREVAPTQDEKERVTVGRPLHSIAVERVVMHALKRAEHVHLLSRRQPNVDLLDHLHRTFPHGKERITSSSAHKYKGKEADAVILVDAVERSYPLVHPHWIFDTIFGSTLAQVIEDERRLLYVALTRAKDHLYVVTDTASPSPFLDDLRQVRDWEPLRWADLEPADGHRTRIFVSGPDLFANKDQLKNRHRFNWDRSKKHWYREITSPEDRSWMSESWAKEPFIERVIIETDRGPLVFHRDLRGNWTHQNR